MAISTIKDDTYYTEQGKTAVKSARDTALKDNTTLYTGQTDITNKTYDAQVDVAGKAYDQSYRENAVQKAINERQVAESMANLGLTNSGLNRTQQTAIQLSYANNKAGIDKQKQSALQDLELKRTQDLAKIEQNKLSSEAQINQYYDGLAQQYATDLKTADVDAYNKWVEEETKRLEAEAKAKTEQQKNYYSYLAKLNENQEKDSYIIKVNGANLSREFEGSLSDKGVTVRYTPEGKTIYTDTKSGKSTTMDSTQNPYTGADNSSDKHATGRAGIAYGYFDNGYQPRGVEGYGKFAGVEDMTDYKGRKQNVFYTISNHQGPHYWLWNGGENRYMEVFVNSDGKWEEKVK